MKTKLTILGICLFVVSFFLPAYESLTGYECAEFCALYTFDLDVGEFAYYFPFTFSNLAMVIMPILLLTKYRCAPVPKVIIVTQVILLLHVLSWLFVERISLILIGYYVWLLSMIIILFVSIYTRRSSNPVRQS